MRPASRAFLVFAAGVSLVAVSAQSLGLLGGGAPTLVSPFALSLAIPAFLNLPMGLVLALPTVVFWFVACPLFFGSCRVPVHTWVLLSLFAVLSTVLYTGGFRYGLRYQGALHTWFCLLASLSLLFTTVIVLRWSRRQPSFPLCLLGHWLLFAWAITYAFPYLGELP